HWSGASMTPSSETNSPATIFRISVVLSHLRMSLMARNGYLHYVDVRDRAESTGRLYSFIVPTDDTAYGRTIGITPALNFRCVPRGAWSRILRSGVPASRRSWRLQY